ncbi:signal peptide peptidase SppA [Virgibacillus sp. W0430]|uniref:signal peptide peptidase SppA n=1 Tax=Virgibacillus sp. W0430 TaxID=3391580 RepID=UPI003F47CC79
MNGKRWLAILLAAALLFISIGFRFATSVASDQFENLFAPQESLFTENVLVEGMGDKVVVLNVNGVIQDLGENPFMSTLTYNHKQFLQMIEAAGADPSIDGIILQVNSPGGGVVESAEIYEKIVEIQTEHEKPIYVSMGNTAASGGYYIAAPADKIVAHPATITGSIGVIMESINFADLAEKYGVDFNTIKSGEFKDIMSASREMTDEERQILQTMIDEIYNDFVDVIVDGRGMTEAKVRELGDGRIYTGKQAVNNGLVDDLGTLDDTINMMIEDYDLSGAQVVEYDSELGFWGMLGISMKSILKSDSELVRIMTLLRESESPRAMYLYSR